MAVPASIGEAARHTVRLWRGESAFRSNELAGSGFQLFQIPTRASRWRRVDRLDDFFISDLVPIVAVRWMEKGYDRRWMEDCSPVLGDITFQDSNQRSGQPEERSWPVKRGAALLPCAGVWTEF